MGIKDYDSNTKNQGNIEKNKPEISNKQIKIYLIEQVKGLLLKKLICIQSI